MKKVILLALFLCSAATQASEWLTSYSEAQKVALAGNKFMLVDFWATWCGPCKKMDADSWNDPLVMEIMQNFVPVRIDIDQNKDLASKYSVDGIPNMYILDGNGKVVYSFVGYRSAVQLKTELQNFALSTEYLSMELINEFKFNGYGSEVRLSQKYFDFSLLVDKEIKNRFLKVAELYLADAKNNLSKKDADYEEKMQKIKLLENFGYAYDYNFKKLDKKMTELSEASIKESNLQMYLFLKLVAAKGLQDGSLSTIQEKVDSLQNHDYITTKADLLFSKQG
jgi:thiol-disulfide isomerase/thioredoxin